MIDLIKRKFHGLRVQFDNLNKWRGTISIYIWGKKECSKRLWEIHEGGKA